ncbi:hypothetical protein L1987_46169 [Smallanthus sonchifolius]|uniref:Uncharacterized protein n=1 Tax=Smallanthus sonchifolius TaxID=185202 RepID=A0ACB9FZ15_9ASTR|nr:hypothetical protein L1987_46169 [Smallanthus sonchifolius]
MHLCCYHNPQHIAPARSTRKYCNCHDLEVEEAASCTSTALSPCSFLGCLCMGSEVHNAESDIDALCVGPWFASLTASHLAVSSFNLVEVSDIHCVKDAKVPLMMFKFEGISVDLPYAQLQVTTVPENVDILNPLFLNGIDETSWKSLSGVRANNSILQLVPDVKVLA